MREWLSTKEVAQYLGLHEKKVYALARQGRLPATRLTGKWLFSRRLLDAWLEESVQGTRQARAAARPVLLVAGSDDPCLGLLQQGYAQRTAPASLFLAVVGSAAGLAALRDGLADLALAHLFDAASGEYNLPYLPQFLPAGGVAVTLFHRELGLLVPPGNPQGLRGLADLARGGLRLVNRQAGSGTRAYLDQELARLGISPQRLPGYEHAVTTHLEVGLKVLRREADVGLATRATARLLGLDFVPLTQERFDLLIPQAHFFSRRVQLLLNLVGSRAFRAQLAALGGYDTSETGRLRAP